MEESNMITEIFLTLKWALLWSPKGDSPLKKALNWGGGGKGQV